MPIFSPAHPLTDARAIMHYPNFETFSRLASGVHLVPVYRRLIGDSLTPVSAFHKLDAGSSACLFESVVGGEKVGRYSFLTAEPFQEVEARGNRVVVRCRGNSSNCEETESFDAADPIEELRKRVDATAGGPPAGIAAVCRRGNWLRRLRRGALLRKAAQCPAGRPQSARFVVRVLRSNGGVRQHHQDDRRRGDGPGRSGTICVQPTTTPAAASINWSIA